jgi:hypothetical protein
MPKEKMSLRGSTGLPSACSGDMNAGVPNENAGLRLQFRRTRRAVGPRREPEIQNFDRAVSVHHDVARLHVAMNNSRRVRFGQGGGDRDRIS